MLVASVWLALMANDWSESRNSDKDTKLLLEKLHNEITYNTSRLNQIETYYKKLNDSLVVNSRRIFRKEKVEFYNFWFGKEEADFLDYAFQLALNTGKMNDLNLDLSMELMKLNSIEKKFSNLISVIYDLDGRGEGGAAFA